MNKVRHIFVAVIIATIAIAGCSSSAGTIETVSPVDAAAIMAESPDVVVLDIRTPEEYSQGIIEGAVNIDFYEADFAAQLDQLDKDVQYVVYCRSGNRSDQAMDTFADLGFTAVAEIDGGIANWYDAGQPVVFP